MILRLIAATLITSGLFAVAPPAQAQTPEISSPNNEWVSRRTMMTYGDGFSDKRRADIEYGETLFTSSTTRPGLYFRCLDKRFRVGLVYEPQSMPDAFKAIKFSGISGNGNFAPTPESLANVSAQIGGQKKIYLGRWLHLEDQAAALSRDNEAARKLYNAVVRGQTIEITIRSKHRVTLAYPKIDSTFADFGAACGIGRNRKTP